VFQSGSAGPLTDLPTVVRQSTNLLVTSSNPVHLGDMLVIYLTGMGAVSPVIGNGLPGPQNPLSMAVSPPDVTLGGVSLSVAFAGLAPGEVGVYQINATVPGDAPQGLSVPLVISQGSSTQTINDLRVVQ
jgi:minor extracellular serine protease Vpr